MLPAPPLRPTRSPPPVESAPRRSGPNRSDRLLQRLHRHPRACPDGRKLSGGLSILAPAVRSNDGGLRVQYMLLIYLDENALSEAERAKCYAESAQFARELSASGQYLTASPLHPTATATSLRVR